MLLGRHSPEREVDVAFGVHDEVWEVIEPLLPAIEAAPIGRPRVPDRVAFSPRCPMSKPKYSVSSHRRDSQFGRCL